jgi:hypothetical protein
MQAYLAKKSYFRIIESSGRSDVKKRKYFFYHLSKELAFNKLCFQLEFQIWTFGKNNRSFQKKGVFEKDQKGKTYPKGGK